MEYLKKKIQDDNDFRFFYFTDRHKAIDERTFDWKSDWYSHWIGFDKICKDIDKDKDLKSLYNEFNLKAIDICKNCLKCKKYINQFNNNRRVFAPFNYLNTPYFTNIKYAPNLIIIDENIKQFKKYFNNFEQAKEVFNKIGLDALVEKINKKNYEGLAVQGLYNDVYEYYKDYLLKAFKRDDETFLKLAK